MCLIYTYSQLNHRAEVQSLCNYYCPSRVLGNNGLVSVSENESKGNTHQGHMYLPRDSLTDLCEFGNAEESSPHLFFQALSCFGKSD